jgi:predicted NUDIX family phosphoesterase
MNTELTLAVPTERLWKILDYKENGVIKVIDSNIMEKILSYGVFKPRNILEGAPLYKQIIPYAVICYNDKVYLFHRTKKQTEVRLHNLFSLGVGGHMNPFGDNTDVAYLRHELEREMNEEVLVHDNCVIESIIPIGFVNDDTNDVGKVHLGVLYNINLSSQSIEINEKDKMTGKWVSKSELKNYYAQMESWSKLYVDLIGL